MSFFDALRVNELFGFLIELWYAKCFLSEFILNHEHFLVVMVAEVNWEGKWLRIQPDSNSSSEVFVKIKRLGN